MSRPPGWSFNTALSGGVASWLGQRQSLFSAFSIKEARLTPSPCAISLQMSTDGTRFPDSKVTIPVRPTLVISDSFFCDRPAFSRASRKTSARAATN
jgi:hypothetical protein